FNDAGPVPKLTWTNPVPISYGTPLGTNQLNATADIPGRFTYYPPSGTVLNAGGSQTLSVVFQPEDTTHYVTITNTVLLTVQQASLLVTANSTNRSYGAT